MHFVSTSSVFLSHKDSIKTKFSDHEYYPKVVTNIGSDVWIGDGVYVKAGVTIGHGAVIGMGAVVTKDVPPYAVFAGNPAKLIRYRFDQSVIEKLLEIAWWDFSDKKIKKYAHLFKNPDAFIKEVK
jgi:acetyltransferase-like isoleucine patch superfamily enzyme